MKSKQRSRTQLLLLGLTGLLTLLTVFGSLGFLHWTLDLFSLFHLQYLLLLEVVGIGLFVSQRRWQAASPVFIPLLLNLFWVAPFFLPNTATTPTADTQPLRVMTLNISTETAGYPQVVALLRERQPDIVFMSEVRADLVALLDAELRELYPVQYAEPSRFTLGVAILARDPDVVVQTKQASANVERMSRRYLQAAFVWDGEPVTLIGIHPLPPLRAAWAESRNQELALMGELARDANGPFILLGDLNATPWSAPMRELTRDGALQYANDGYGIWPTFRLAGGLLGAPLDHILLSSEWSVVDYSEAGDIGSDHVPVQADVVLRRGLD